MKKEADELGIFFIPLQVIGKQSNILIIPNSSLYFGVIYVVISCHTGIGCFGIQYIKKYVDDNML